MRILPIAECWVALAVGGSGGGWQWRWVAVAVGGSGGGWQRRLARQWFFMRQTLTEKPIYAPNECK